MTMDTPGASTQVKLNRQKGQARVMMKTTGVLVEPSMKKAPRTHKGFCGVGTQKESDAPEHPQSNAWNVRKCIAVTQKVQRRPRTNWICVQHTQHMHNKQECECENTHSVISCRQFNE